MIQSNAQPIKTYTGTWDEVLAHRDEIPKTSEVEVRVFEAKSSLQDEPSLALLESWLTAAPTEPEAIHEAEADLREFKRNLNLPRQEIGARLHFPEVATADNLP